MHEECTIWSTIWSTIFGPRSQSGARFCARRMHDLEHDFAVSNVELEGGDRGMKIVVQIVLQIVQILCSLNTNFLAVSLKDSHP